MNIDRLSRKPDSAATARLTRAEVSRSPRRVSRSEPREIRQATKIAAATKPIAPRHTTNGVGCIPASYAKRDSGPSVPNSDAATNTIAKPITGGRSTAVADPVAGRAAVGATELGIGAMVGRGPISRGAQLA